MVAHPANEARQEARWAWSTETYYRAGELGWFGQYRTELIEGEVFIKMSPQGAPHAVCMQLTAREISSKLVDGIVREALPISVSDQSEPEPDMAVVAGSIRDYETHHPYPTEIKLVVEISDSSLSLDRGAKALVYARAGIRSYWIVDLNGRRVEVRRHPSVDGYAEVQSFGEDSALSDDCLKTEIRVADLLPTATGA